MTEKGQLLTGEAANDGIRQLEATFDAISDAVWLMDANCRIQRCNRATRELFGKQDNEIIGRHCWEIVHGTSEPIPGCPMSQMRESGCRGSMELSRGDRWYRVTVDPLFDAADTLTGAVHIIRNITEARRADLARQFSQFTLDHMSMGMFWVDTDWHFVEVNTAATLILGYTRDELLQMTVSNVDADFPPEDRPRRWSEFKAKGIVTFETRHRTKDGRLVPVEVTASYIKLGETEYLCASVHDITERKRVDLQLLETETRFRAVFEQAGDAIVVFDPDTLVIQEFNNEACLRLGYTREEFAKLKIPDFEILESAEEVKMHCKRIATEGFAHFETRHRTKSGAIKDVEIRSKIIHLGGKTTLVGIWRDITERKQTEKALHALKIELEQRVEERTAQLRHEISQRQLLEREILEISGHERRRISHDLHDSVGQRLTGLKFLSSALSQRLARTKVRDASAAANISTELGKAIEEVRDIAYGLHPVQHNVESLMFSLQHLAENVTKTFKVPCHFECHQPVLFHDYSAATHLYRIAQEAAGNAARHAKAEDIRITLDQDDAFIHLRVIDNGRGLSSTTRRRKGLGMEIMKYRTSAIGATLDIINGKNGGTVVHCAYHTHTTAKEID